jgi:uncharacterized protein
VRRGVGKLDTQAIVEAENADAHEVGQVRGVANLLIELELARGQSFTEVSDAIGQVAVEVGFVRQLADRLQFPAAAESDAERQREKNRLRADECDDHPVHGRRIAQAGFARYPSAGRPRERRGPDWGPAFDVAIRRRPSEPWPARFPGGMTLRLRLIPREERFFDLFVEDAVNVLAGARQLEAMLRTYDEPEARAAEIRATEHRGDEISHDIGHRLEATFVTPFDREDIYALISALDDVIDLIEETADTFVLYRIEGPTATAVEQASIIVKQVELLHDALAHLKGFKGLDKYWIEVHRLENEGDSLVRSAIAGLFNEEMDPITLVKWKDVYGLLEDTIDKAEDVANIIERITIKHA